MSFSAPPGDCAAALDLQTGRSMNPFSEDLRALLAVQNVDSRIDRLRATLVSLDSGAATAASYNADKATFDKQHTAALKAQAEQHDTELRLQSIETKIEQVNKSMYDGSVIGARELGNLQKELDMLGRQKADAEEKVLVAMEAATSANEEALRQEAALTALANNYRATRAAYKSRSVEINAEIAAAQTERDAAAKPVPPALLVRYEAIRPKKGGVAAAPLGADATCGACHTKLNVGLIEAVRDSSSAQLCEYCGRILVPTVVL
jgi:predicted  nucleic acid-binding Zn-ribbon protein